MHSALLVIGCCLGCSVPDATSGTGTPDAGVDGSAGTGGVGGTGGQTGTGGTTSSGGTTGHAGAAGSGGTAGSAGIGGTGGAAGISGSGGSAGASGSGGSAGAAGMAGYGVLGQSCDGLGNICKDGYSFVSCCDRISVPGGTFEMGRGDDGTDTYAGGQSYEQPEHDATVDAFVLDSFEVTVGRFRRYVGQYDGTAPPPGAGAHPLIADSGWRPAWDAYLPASQAALIASLKCQSTENTWTDTPSDEDTPINCVSWYVAFAFCAWDGGRLPTEAELEYAAAGSLDRRFAWGEELDATRANYADTGNSSFVAVGSFPAGDGEWGHHDLAGSLWEWALDAFDASWYSPLECVNCANTDDTAEYRLLKGGCFLSPEASLRAAARWYGEPAKTYGAYGFRCASAP